MIFVIALAGIFLFMGLFGLTALMRGHKTRDENYQFTGGVVGVVGTVGLVLTLVVLAGWASPYEVPRPIERAIQQKCLPYGVARIVKTEDGGTEDYDKFVFACGDDKKIRDYEEDGDEN